MTDKPFTNAAGAPVADNTNIMTAGRRGPALLQDIWLIEKLAHFDREVIPERRMHAKGWGAHGTFTVKVCELLDQPDVLQQRWTARPGRLDIEVVAHRLARRMGQVWRSRILFHGCSSWMAPSP